MALTCYLTLTTLLGHESVGRGGHLLDAWIIGQHNPVITVRAGDESY